MLNDKIYNRKKYDDSDTTFASFMEIITAGIKALFFCICVYVLQEVLNFIVDVFFNIEGHYLEIVKCQVIPMTLLIVLSLYALYVINKN